MVTAKLYEIEDDNNEDSIDSYMLPSKCPSCGAPLRLDEVDWIDSKSALCPRCETIIGVIIV
jgi:ribosomal protein S27AE